MNNIHDTILRKLQEMETTENCRLLLAAESGSRAWGYASQTSDYDVRAIYRRRRNDYLTLRPLRDTIEWEMNEVYDINAWDLRKALQLAITNNVSVYEWADSPIHYHSSEWLPEFRALTRSVLYPPRLAQRYLGMAASTVHRYLDREQVPYKQYFYALRPLLAARWVLQEQMPAPVPFAELRHLLPDHMQPVADELLALRNGSTEKAQGPAHPQADAFILRELAHLTEQAQSYPRSPQPNIAPLEDFFLRVIDS